MGSHDLSAGAAEKPSNASKHTIRDGLASHLRMSNQ
jgi:hypothetical protein